MKNIAIIGAGQLGSRHLQGILKTEGTLSVFVVDPSDASLQIAESRAKEIDSNHKVQYFKDLQDTPQHLDLVIIATGADVREKVINQLVNHAHVGFLILEKVLFQEIEAYRRVSDLLQLKNVPTWVNHPRRMFSHYQELRDQINENKSPLVYEIVGANWGLGCNALHFLDLICYLSNSAIESLETNWLDPEIRASKRIGYIEFTGTLKGSLINGDRFSITSFNAEPSGITMFIASAAENWTVFESGASQIIRCDSAATKDPQITSIKALFQSESTTLLASELFGSNNCKLPAFSEAMASHIHFIESMLHFYNKVTKEQTKILRIT